MTKLATSISPQYVKNWDIPQAIREIIQNTLDSKTEFKCKIQLSHSGGWGLAADSGPGLETRHLALGISEKSESSIGKFGEGLKLAFLVFCREGRIIEVRARDKLIMPHIRFDEGYGTEVLVLDVENGHPEIKGTQVRFECSIEEFEDGKSYFAALRGFDWMERGRISTPGGDVYVNGARVGRIEDAIFSYHLTQEESSEVGNRDREVLDRSKLDDVVRNRILSATKSRRVRRMLLESVVDGSGYECRLGIHYGYIPSTLERKWALAFARFFGPRTVAAVSGYANQQELSQINHKGYQAIFLPRQWYYPLTQCKVPTIDFVLNKSGRSTARISMDKLTDNEKTNLERARVLVEMHYKPIGKLYICESVEKLTGAAWGSNPYGAYRHDNDTIYIARRALADMRTALHTVLHEAIHKHSKENDCTTGYQDAALGVAVSMILK